MAQPNVTDHIVNHLTQLTTMGIKKIFKKKEPTEEELVAEMQKVGITTKGVNGRPEKFGAFRQYAQERLSQKGGMAPVNPYSNMSNTLANPYASSGTESKGSSGGGSETSQNGSPYATQQNPYGAPGSGSSGASPYGVSSNGGANPYGGSANGSASPYGSAAANPYGRPLNRSAERERAPARSNGGSARADPYASAKPRGGRDDELILDLNAIPTNQPAVALKKPIRRPAAEETDSLDLNYLPEDDLNVEVDDFLPEQEQVNSEDEEVEAIRQDIRFVKQESVALTRNTLRMAQEADASGTNTMGMLGSQSERLYNAEQNLLLADTQTSIAESKVKELRRLNRSIFIPATGNPFNKKSRLRQQEANLKTQKEQEKYLRETNRQGVYASEQRLKQGITTNATSSDTYSKYQGEKHLQQAQRYQFENDSEDDEMEKELASNLDQIATYSKKLQNTAKVMGQEVEAQNLRLGKIEEDADRLDINVHLNSTRLSNIR